MERVIKAIAAHTDVYIDQATDRVIASRNPAYMRFSREALREIIAPTYRCLLEDLERGTNEVHPAHFRRVGALRAQQGAAIDDVILGISLGFDVISEHIEQAFAGDLEAQLWWEKTRRDVSYRTAAMLTAAYFEAREAVIAAQHAQILGLSAPIMPAARGVLVMPLVGSVSEERAAQIIEGLLARISREGAAAVIIDITGVAAMDTAVAGLLVQTAQAARLLGARVILAGISPALAQTIVRMGISLQGVTTVADLESGVVHALRLRGKVITDAGDSP